MNKSLPLLILLVIFLCWKFVFTSSRVEYTDPARVLQGLSMALSYKTAIIRYWQEKGSLPTAEDWQEKKDKPVVDLSQSLVGSIRIAEDGPGVISVYFRNKPEIEMRTDISGTRILLIPEVGEGKLKWSCEGTVPAELMPKKCVRQGS